MLAGINRWREVARTAKVCRMTSSTACRPVFCSPSADVFGQQLIGSEGRVARQP